MGGLMIGTSAAMAYLIDGKITGISGIMGPFLRGAMKCDPVKACVFLQDDVDQMIFDF